RRYFAADDELAVFGIESESIQFLPQISFKNRFDHGSAFTRADHFGGRFRARKQTQCIDDNGFTSAGLAREEIEALFEVKFELIDEGKISNAKEPQHTRAL